MATMMSSSRRFSVRTKKSKRTRNRSRRLACELLEDRRVLAVVTTLADSGAGSLRDAIARRRRVTRSPLMFRARLR